MDRQQSRLALAAVLSLALSACGADETGASPARETVTVTVTPTSEAPTSQADDSGSPPDNASPTSASPSTGSVPTDRVGQPLSLADAQSSYPEWEEGLYEVADRTNVRAMGTPVTNCGDQGDYSPRLEFRLANRFKTLSLNVAQANSSKDSDQTLVVVVEGNDKQIDIQQVPFNEVVSISDLNIEGVNALRVRIFLDDEDDDCAGGNGATAVVEKLVVT